MSQSDTSIGWKLVWLGSEGPKAERRAPAITRTTWLMRLAWAAGFVPLPTIWWLATHHALGRDPYRGLITETGRWTMWFLCATLVITPVRRLTHWNEVIRYRRTLGLLAFFYGVLHFLSYIICDRFAGLEFRDDMLSWTTARDLTSYTMVDVFQRPFLLIGFVSFLIMVPLAITSSPAMIRLLGGRRWRHLHRFVYAAAIAGLLHHWWPLGDRFQFDDYGVILGAVFLYRLYRARPRRRPLATVAP